ncbi:Coatomer subunit zeta-1 [Boothiomyces sp. JEL0866]|nr:Coatomer subunit zeta-1 [Boothiomyces sp. JEL0866]
MYKSLIPILLLVLYLSNPITFNSYNFYFFSIYNKFGLQIGLLGNWFTIYKYRIFPCHGGIDIFDCVCFMGYYGSNCSYKINHFYSLYQILADLHYFMIEAVHESYYLVSQVLDDYGFYMDYNYYLDYISSLGFELDYRIFSIFQPVIQLLKYFTVMDVILVYSIVIFIRNRNFSLRSIAKQVIDMYQFYTYCPMLYAVNQTWLLLFSEFNLEYYAFMIKFYLYLQDRNHLILAKYKKISILKNFKPKKAIVMVKTWCNLTLKSIKSVFIFDSEGKKLLSKYYYPIEPKDAQKLEKNLFDKTRRTNSDIILFDNLVVVYKPVVDLFIYVVGGLDENEIMLVGVLNCFIDACSNLLKNQMEKRSLMDNLDTILLVLDETIDDG